MNNLRITGTTYPLRDMLRTAGATWDGAAWTIDAERWQRIFADRAPGKNRRDREITTAIAGCVAAPAAAAGAPHTVQTPCGALIASAYTQAERCAMQRSGIDTDCDDHDLI